MLLGSTHMPCLKQMWGQEWSGLSRASRREKGNMLSGYCLYSGTLTQRSLSTL